MFSDWQTIAVWLIIFAAFAYVGRRGWGRLRSFGASGRAQGASCATGCGSCGDEQTTKAHSATAKPQNVLVQITNAGRETRRQHKP
ncbi:MAG TPA: FeoB-associated Cys-rich membrane protein [Pyrinomonadaceae bacterium]|jgi:hypothetical protein